MHFVARKQENPGFLGGCCTRACLLDYFRAISPRGMQMRPPEIRQILSLGDNAQALAVKKVADKKAAGNEWTIIRHVSSGPRSNAALHRLHVAPLRAAVVHDR